MKGFRYFNIFKPALVIAGFVLLSSPNVMAAEGNAGANIHWNRVYAFETISTGKIDKSKIADDQSKKVLEPRASNTPVNKQTDAN